MEWRYDDWGAIYEAMLKPSSEAQNSFWIKNRTGEDTEHFPAGPIDKAVLSFTNSLTRIGKGPYVKGDADIRSIHLY